MKLSVSAIVLWCTKKQSANCTEKTDFHFFADETGFVVSHYFAQTLFDDETLSVSKESNTCYDLCNVS